MRANSRLRRGTEFSEIAKTRTSSGLHEGKNFGFYFECVEKSLVGFSKKRDDLTYLC